MVVTHSVAGGEASILSVVVVSGVLVLMTVIAGNCLTSVVCVSCVAPLLSVIIVVFGMLLLTTVVTGGCGVDVKLFSIKLHFVLPTIIVKLVCG